MLSNTIIIWHQCTINYAINKMDFFFIVGHICVKDKDHQMS
jgi:hypothetical protein